VVTFLPPDLSITFLVSILVPLVLGFIVGILVKTAFKIGIVIVVLLLILIVAGMIAPDNVLTPLIGWIKAGGTTATEWVHRIAGYLPYTSLVFIIGLVIGFLKG